MCLLYLNVRCQHICCFSFTLIVHVDRKPNPVAITLPTKIDLLLCFFHTSDQVTV